MWVVDSGIAGVRGWEGGGCLSWRARSCWNSNLGFTMGLILVLINMPLLPPLALSRKLYSLIGRKVSSPLFHFIWVFSKFLIYIYFLSCRNGYFHFAVFESMSKCCCAYVSHISMYAYDLGMVCWIHVSMILIWV